jgi:hypothetical protein
MFAAAIVALTLNASQLHLVEQEDLAAQVHSLQSDRRSTVGPLMMIITGAVSLAAGAVPTVYALASGLVGLLVFVATGWTVPFLEVLPYLIIAAAGLTLLSGGIFVMVLGIRLMREARDFNEGVQAVVEPDPNDPWRVVAHRERAAVPMTTVFQF